MYVKTVGKYEYACHNYLDKDGKQKTKSFGRINEEEANTIRDKKIPEGLKAKFEEWYNQTIIFHYRHREKHVEDFPTDKEKDLELQIKTLETRLEEAKSRILELKTKTGKYYLIDQLMQDILNKKLENDPSLRPKRWVEEVLQPLFNGEPILIKSKK